MLIARKSRLLNQMIYRGLIRSALRRRFDRVNLRRTCEPVDPAFPLILCANHSSWWDGHLMMALNEIVLKRDGYLMMEHAQLARYPFFRAAGAFSVDRANARRAAESAAYAAQLLSEAPNRMLLIFPQGEILGNDARPLRFENGVGHIARTVTERAGACALLPVALRYEFIGEPTPEAFISVGPPLVLRGDLRPKDVSARIASALSSELDALREDVAQYRLASFTPLLRGAPSVNRVLDRALGRAPLGDVGRR